MSIATIEFGICVGLECSRALPVHPQGLRAPSPAQIHYRGRVLSWMRKLKSRRVPFSGNRATKLTCDAHIVALSSRWSSSTQPLCAVRNAVIRSGSWKDLLPASAPRFPPRRKSRNRIKKQESCREWVHHGPLAGTSIGTSPVVVLRAKIRVALTSRLALPLKTRAFPGPGKWAVLRESTSTSMPLF